MFDSRHLAIGFSIGRTKLFNGDPTEHVVSMTTAKIKYCCIPRVLHARLSTAILGFFILVQHPEAQANICPDDGRKKNTFI